MATVKKFITTQEVEGLVRGIKRGQLFSMHFKRVAPKCTSCGKSNKKWQGLTVCPECGAPLSLERETMAQLGVHNPSNETIAPKGVGETAQEALENGRIKYFDMNAQENGKRGGFRQAAIENVTRLTIEGVDYFVMP